DREQKPPGSKLPGGLIFYQSGLITEADGQHAFPLVTAQKPASFSLSFRPQSHVQQVSLFARHFNRSPELLGPEDIRSYQVYLTNERKLAPSSILIAIAALRFLYKITLHKDWSLTEVIPTPKKPKKLPI